VTAKRIGRANTVLLDCVYRCETLSGFTPLCASFAAPSAARRDTADHQGDFVPASGVTSGRWAAPGRINLIGEHTDYNEGFVLPFALPHRTVVAARRRPDRTWRVRSDAAPDSVELTPDDLAPGRVAGWAAYVAGVIWALTDAGHGVPGADLDISSNVPVGAGLSSSAALECAVLTALCDLGDLDIATVDRPQIARQAENAYVGVPCGVMDQAASILCRAGHALFLDCRSLATDHIPLDLARFGLTVLVIDTRAEHRHVGNEYADRQRSCELAARTLGIASLRDVHDLDAALSVLPDEVTRRRARHVVTENARVWNVVDLLRDQRPRDIGPELTASHVSLRDDYEVTIPELDLAVDVALDSGAYGARMTGGGFGGCVIALVDTEAVDPVRHAVVAAFGRAGMRTPNVFEAAASAGAARID